MKNNLSKQYFLGIVCIFIFGITLFTTPVHAAPYDITEYTPPTSGGISPLTEDSHGNIWFTISSSSQAPKVAKLDPITGAINEYTVPSSIGYLSSSVVEADNNIWFIDTSSANSLVMLNPSNGNMTKFPIPTINSGPRNLIVDNTGKLWFIEYSVDKIASFDPNTTSFAEYSLLTSSADPQGLTIAQDGTVWLVETMANKIVRLNPVTGVVTEVVNVGFITVLSVGFNPPPAVPVAPPVRFPVVLTLIAVLP